MDARVRLIEAAIVRPSEVITFHVLRASGLPTVDCVFEVVGSWEAPALDAAGWVTVSATTAAPRWSPSMEHHQFSDH